MTAELETTRSVQPPAVQIRETVATIKARVQMVQHVMKDVMKRDVHYGTIPGTPKPTLYKPGAEIIALAFQFAPRYQVDDLSTTESVHYRITCELYSRETGAFIGSGQGECSSDEEKYKWRKTVCEPEYEATPEDRRRQKFYKNGGTAQQVRIEPADIANTVLKMAEKRAFIDAIRTTTGCSDMFGQDLEDLPAEVREGMTGNEQPEPPKPLGEEAWQKLVAQAEGFGYSAEDIVASAAAAGYEGPPAGMPRDLSKTLYRSMRDEAAAKEAKHAADQQREQAATPTQTAQISDEPDDGGPYVSDEETAPESPASDDDEQPPGRGALFDAGDPDRKASAGDKKALSEALAHVDAAAVKQYRQRFDGRGNSELSHGECAEFTAWAVGEALE